MGENEQKSGGSAIVPGKGSDPGSRRPVNPWTNREAAGKPGGSCRADIRLSTEGGSSRFSQPSGTNTDGTNTPEEPNPGANRV